MEFVQNDTPVLTFMLRERAEDGTRTPVDLTGRTVDFRVVRLDTGTYTDAGWNPAVVVDAAGGLIQCPIPTGAWSQPGEYVLHIRVSSATESFRIITEEIRVLPEPA